MKNWIHRIVKLCLFFAINFHFPLFAAINSINNKKNEKYCEESGNKDVWCIIRLGVNVRIRKAVELETVKFIIYWN